MPLRLHTRGLLKGACAPRTLKEALKPPILSSQLTVLNSQAGKGQGHTANNHAVLVLQVPGLPLHQIPGRLLRGPGLCVCGGDACLWEVISLLEISERDPRETLTSLTKGELSQDIGLYQTRWFGAPTSRTPRIRVCCLFICL